MVIAADYPESLNTRVYTRATERERTPAWSVYIHKQDVRKLLSPRYRYDPEQYGW